MKVLIVLTALSITWFTLSLAQNSVGAATYNVGIEAYLNKKDSSHGIIVESTVGAPNRGPAIEIKHKQ